MTIYSTPGGESTGITAPAGIQFEVDGDTRTEVDGKVWYQQAQGWVAEKTIDGSEVYLEAIDSDTVGQTVAFTNETAASLAKTLTGALSNMAGKAEVQAKEEVKVRTAPKLTGSKVVRNLELAERIEVDMNTLTEADGYIWVQHEYGWSAIQSVDGESIFLVAAGSIVILSESTKAENLPGYNTLLVRHPVDIASTEWVQFFGNTTFAYTDGAKYNYDGYAQGFHAGLDYGNGVKAGIPIFAGVEAEYMQTLKPDSRNVQIWLVKDDYIFIYQHIINPKAFKPGDKITPDTQLAEIHHNSQGGWDHLHFEIRYQENWIVNPLALMTPELRSAWTGKFNPELAGTGKSGSKLYYFYITDRFNQWGTTLDQPVIKRRGKLRAPSYNGF